MAGTFTLKKIEWSEQAILTGVEPAAQFDSTRGILAGPDTFTTCLLSSWEEIDISRRERSTHPHAYDLTLGRVPGESRKGDVSLGLVGGGGRWCFPLPAPSISRQTDRRPPPH